MKIFHPILCYYPSQAGGPANTLYWLNNALEKKDIKSRVLTTTFGLEKPFDKDQVSREVSTAFQKVTFIESKGFHFLKLGFKNVKHSDIIQFSSLFFPPTLPLLLYAIFKKKPIILGTRGELYESALAIKSFKKRIWIKIIKRLQRDIHFLATNNEESQIIKTIFPNAKSVTIIPNYIQLPKRITVTKKNQFVFLGRINPIKNIKALIHAFYKLTTNSKTDVSLLIVGAARLGYELNYLKELKQTVKALNLENKVVFKGHLDGQEKNTMLANSLALILPSHSENFGNVVLEALAQGTPVIASKNTPWQILEHYKAGYWVKNSSESLCITMKHILNQSEVEQLSISENAFNLCDTKFNISNNIDVWIEYYQKINNHV